MFLCFVILLLGVCAFGSGCEEAEAQRPPADDGAPVLTSEILDYFGQIAAFPRSGPSYPNDLGAYLLEQAEAIGVDAKKDKAGNVTMRIPATDGKENVQPIALLTYTGADIVSDPFKAFDPYKDGVELAPQGNKVHSDGTSMGADGALGAATMLAVMKAAVGMPHGEITAIFAAGTGDVSSADATAPAAAESAAATEPTAATETAIAATAAKPPYKIPEGALLINIGGTDTGRIVDESPVAALINATTTASAVETGAGRAYVIGASGFPAGVAATKPEDGYISPIAVISKILSEARNAGCVYKLCSFSGGDDACTYPTSAQATVILGDYEERQFKRVVASAVDEAMATLGGDESGADISMIETERPAYAIGEESVSKALTYLYGMMNLNIAGSGGEAAMNVGKLRFDATGFDCSIAVTGMYSKADTVAKIVSDQVAIEYLSGIPSQQFGEIAGFSNFGTEDVDRLSERFSAAYAKAFGSKPRSEASLELSPLGKLAEGRAVKSIGITVYDRGTPNEYFEAADAAVPANAILRYIEGE
ncbi:MAG: hypothetical protein LBG82_01545 [Clostridiales Family XIII bacterium]|nr:hypothetical protein [Clostridiales Family XIII bacterium]